MPSTYQMSETSFAPGTFAAPCVGDLDRLVGVVPLAVELAERDVRALLARVACERLA